MSRKKTKFKGVGTVGTAASRTKKITAKDLADMDYKHETRKAKLMADRGVTAPVTAPPMTEQEKVKYAEPIMSDINKAMGIAHNLGRIEGSMAGHAKGFKLGMTAPRSRGEFMAKAALPAIDAVLAEVRAELIKAYTKHPVRQASPHESYAVLLEETDELWDEIKADRGRMATGRKEGVQVAAMAVRYLVDINPR